MHIGALAIYPLKSGRQVSLKNMALDRFGPAGDRRWMLVDASGRFVTQRTHPRMCLMAAAVENGRLLLQAPGQPDLVVEPVTEPDQLTVTVWNDQVAALAVSPAADAWCSTFLNMPVRLVWMPESTQRAVSPAHAGAGHTTGFSDGFPLLLVTQSSLDHLNTLLPYPVDWRRFRPNIVIAGDLPPHAEDGWKHLRIGDVELAVVKPCSRCVIPSIDPDTADKNGQILTVMRKYRAGADGKTYFGQNVIISRQPEGTRLNLGDAVRVLA